MPLLGPELVNKILVSCILYTRQKKIHNSKIFPLSFPFNATPNVHADTVPLFVNLRSKFLFMMGEIVP